MKLKLLVLLFAFLALAAPAWADGKSYEQKIKEHPFNATIAEANKTLQGRDLLDFFDTNVTQDASLLPVISLWLRDHSINEKESSKINSLFFLSYADTLLAMAEGYKTQGDPDQYRSLYKTALLNLSIFELMGSVDAARCQDPSAMSAIKMMSMDRVDGTKDAYKMFPKGDLDKIQKSALDEEERLLDRPPNTDICSMGQARIIDLSKTPGTMQKTVADPRFPGGARTIYVPPAGYVYRPAIAPDDEWLDRRKQILSRVTEEWAKRAAAAQH